MNRPALLASAALVAGAAIALPVPQAAACGGFFCSAATQSPIYQAGERVLFIDEADGQVTMHIEVTYEGEPTEFGWLVPIPAPPTDANGQVLPLEQIVGLSSQAVFPLLDNSTLPVLVTQDGEPLGPGCDFFTDGGGGGFGCGESATAASGAGFNTSGVAPNEIPLPVRVADDAKVGPYDAQLLQTQSSDALFQWLGDNGYYQDPMAKPLLGYYVSQGYSFVGIRLQNGKDTGDIKPIKITLRENAPCVPLRLTAIAATPGMPVYVWVLGEGRAVPKNFLHAQLNEARIDFSNPESYGQVLREAIEEAEGLAFVTEFAGPPLGVVDSLALLPRPARDPAPFAEATSLAELIGAIGDARLGDNPDVLQLFAEAIAVPEGFDPQTFHRELLDGGIDVEELEALDFDALLGRFMTEVYAPLEELAGHLDSADTLTRLVTILDPEDMVRDPIFAFNPSLPDVPLQRTMTARTFTTSSCEGATVADYSNGTRTVIPEDAAGSVGDPGGSALLYVEILDETGEGTPISVDQIPEVDALLQLAQLGQPTLPEAFEAEAPSTDLFDPPKGWGGPEDGNGIGPAPDASEDDEEGCQLAALPSTLLWLGVALAFIAWRRRRVPC